MLISASSLHLSLMSLQPAKLTYFATGGTVPCAYIGKLWLCSFGYTF